LIISKQLVEMMGGKIGVHSLAGLGSTFWFYGRFRDGGTGSCSAGYRWGGPGEPRPGARPANFGRGRQPREP
jgi:hypothetical protein